MDSQPENQVRLILTLPLFTEEEIADSKTSPSQGITVRRMGASLLA